MATYPWIVSHEAQGMNLADFPHLKMCFDRIRDREATKCACAIGDTIKGKVDLAADEEARKYMFGRGAVRR
jgi:GST-like protein